MRTDGFFTRYRFLFLCHSVYLVQKCINDIVYCNLFTFLTHLLTYLVTGDAVLVENKSFNRRVDKQFVKARADQFCIDTERWWEGTLCWQSIMHRAPPIQVQSILCSLMYKTAVYTLVNGVITHQNSNSSNITKMWYYAAWHCLSVNNGIFNTIGSVVPVKTRWLL